VQHGFQDSVEMVVALGGVMAASRWVLILSEGGWCPGWGYDLVRLGS
jgi:hypothetical protein